MAWFYKLLFSPRLFGRPSRPSVLDLWGPDELGPTVLLCIFKPGARGLWPRAPGFLKLFWSACRYACVCVCVCVCLCVRPRGH